MRSPYQRTSRLGPYEQPSDGRSLITPAPLQLGSFCPPTLDGAARELDFSRFHYPRMFPQSAEVGRSKRESKSVVYENRTKSAKCGGLETSAPRERISGSDRLTPVRRFASEVRGYWRFQRARSGRRMLFAEGLAEREELGSNGLLICGVSIWLPRETDIQLAY